MQKSPAESWDLHITCKKEGKIYVKRWILRSITLSRDSEQATLAGLGAEMLRAGQFTPSEVTWLKDHYFQTELELGRCLRLPQEGPCECDLYLTCAKFVTTPAYAPRLRRRLRIEHELVEAATTHGWQREVERHQCTIRRLEQLLTDLGETLDGPEFIE